MNSQNKKVAVRLFRGLAGSPLSGSASGSVDRLIGEKRRKKPSKMIGSQDATVGTIPDQTAENDPRRFLLQFDPKLRRGKKPEGVKHIHTGNPKTQLDADGNPYRSFEMAAQAMPRGIQVGYLNDGAGQESVNAPRRSTPKWMLNRCKFREFLRSRRSDDSERAAMDYTILYAYYFERKEDADIFRASEADLRAEAKGKKRWTSSTNALKNRRTRLVEIGNVSFPDSLPDKPDAITDPDWVLLSKEFDKYVLAGGHLDWDNWIVDHIQQRPSVPCSRAGDRESFAAKNAAILELARSQPVVHRPELRLHEVFTKMSDKDRAELLPMPLDRPVVETTEATVVNQ